MKKIIIFGNKKITQECIDILKHSSDVKLLAVVGCETEDDIKLNKFSLNEYCNKNNVLYYHQIALDNQFLKIFKELQPDLCFSIFYRGIFTEEYLSLVPMGFINIHPSLLPKYRGPSPSLWAMLNDEEKVGVTMHYIDLGIDTGDIIKQVEYKIPPNATGFEVQKSLMELSVKLFENQFPLILNGTNNRVPQNDLEATYFGLFHNNIKKINWFSPIKKIISSVNIFTKPYGGAFSQIQNKKVIIWKAAIKPMSKKNLSGPGKIVEVKEDKFIVAGTDGFLSIEEYELPEISQADYNQYIRPENRFDIYL